MRNLVFFTKGSKAYPHCRSRTWKDVNIVVCNNALIHSTISNNRFKSEMLKPKRLDDLPHRSDIFPELDPSPL